MVLQMNILIFVLGLLMPTFSYVCVPLSGDVEEGAETRQKLNK